MNPKQNPPQWPKLINLNRQWLNTHHRSGWPYVIKNLLPLHSPDGVLFDGFLEKKFAWGHDPGDRYNHFEPYRVPWVGVLHNPPAIPPWFNLNQHDPHDIFKTPEWKESVVWCQGLFTLSEHLKKWLESRLSIPICNLMHPTETPELLFSMERFLANQDKKLVQVGWWLRRTSSFFQLRINRLRKVLLNIGHDYMNELIRRELELTRDPSLANNVELVQYVPAADYDALLSQNLVFLDLYDSSANNVIIECIARSTPILINPHPAVREYLGVGYPLYFHNLEHAANLIQDLDQVSAAHEYLRNLPWKHELSGEAFRSEFASSKIYQSLRRPAPKISVVTSVFSADLDIRSFLEDITRQTVFDLCELLLSDVTASHRNSRTVEAVIREYMDRYPNIIYEQISDDPGPFELWNRQIRQARGPYIAMAPLDDRRSPKFLEYHLLALEMNPHIDVICAGVYGTRTANETWDLHTAHRTYAGSFNWQTQDKSSLGSRFDFGLDDLFYRNDEGEWIDSDCLPHCMPVWRKSLHERFGYFNERKYGLADWEFWIRCAAGGARFRLLRSVLGLYLENPNSHNRRYSTESKRWIIEEYKHLAKNGVATKINVHEPQLHISKRGNNHGTLNNGNRFLIFALARTGSTTLMNVLNQHPSIRCLKEPFNPDNDHATYLQRVSDQASLFAVLEEVWQTYNGIKHVWHPSGWPFSQNSSFNNWLLTAGCRVIFLHRANKLQRIVSSQISQQSGVYHIDDYSAREHLLRFQFAPLDTDWIAQQLWGEQKWLMEARQCLRECSLPFLELIYEELYTASLSAQGRLHKINQLLEFLDQPPFEIQKSERVIELLDPKVGKLNSQEVYHRIPGIEEIEHRFGSDDTGWLFK
jgi:hypothetical protein